MNYLLYAVPWLVLDPAWLGQSEPPPPSVTAATLVAAAVLLLFLLGCLWRFTHTDPRRGAPTDRPDELV